MMLLLTLLLALRLTLRLTLRLRLQRLSSPPAAGAPCQGG